MPSQLPGCAPPVVKRFTVQTTSEADFVLSTVQVLHLVDVIQLFRIFNLRFIHGGLTGFEFGLSIRSEMRDRAARKRVWIFFGCCGSLAAQYFGLRQRAKAFGAALLLLPTEGLAQRCSRYFPTVAYVKGQEQRCHDGEQAQQDEGQLCECRSREAADEAG